MIPEYKLFHGAVLAEIISDYGRRLTIDLAQDDHRLLNYMLNDKIGIQIKYATQRLHPWHFTFPPDHVQSLMNLQSISSAVFLILVCNTEGIVAVRAEEVIPSLKAANGEQSWLRADRKKREMFRLYGPNGEFALKFKTNVRPITEALNQLARSNT